MPWLTRACSCVLLSAWKGLCSTHPVCHRCYCQPAFTFLYLIIAHHVRSQAAICGNTSCCEVPPSWAHMCPIMQILHHRKVLLFVMFESADLTMAAFCRDYSSADVLTTANALQASKLQSLSVACGRVRVPKAYTNVTLTVASWYATWYDVNSTQSTECQQAAQQVNQTGNALCFSCRAQVSMTHW